MQTILICVFSSLLNNFKTQPGARNVIYIISYTSSRNIMEIIGYFIWSIHFELIINQILSVALILESIFPPYINKKWQSKPCCCDNSWSLRSKRFVTKTNELNNSGFCNAQLKAEKSFNKVPAIIQSGCWPQPCDPPHTHPKRKLPALLTLLQVYKSTMKACSSLPPFSQSSVFRQEASLFLCCIILLCHLETCTIVTSFSSTHTIKTLPRFDAFAMWFFLST